MKVYVLVSNHYKINLHGRKVLTSTEIATASIDYKVILDSVDELKSEETELTCEVFDEKGFYLEKIKLG